MELTEHILTGNDCWKAGRTIKPKGIMVHSTGVAQPDVRVFLKTWDKPGVLACAHAFVHQDGVTQTLPWNWRGWHAGGKANNTHISFEILEPAGHTYAGGVMVGYDAEKNAAYFQKVYRNAVELSAMLCKRYGIDPMTGILDHAEGYRQGLASNHADVDHWFPKHGKSMDTFRADVKQKLEGEAEEMTQEEFDRLFAKAMADYNARINAREVSDWAKEDWEQAAADGLLDGSRPAAPLTREQAATVLMRLKKEL